jgi:A/G-specific adenine glycosylase
VNSFSGKLIEWHRKAGRHDLPWQREPTPYRVWISEIMLQQTQVGTVIPYFERFMGRFPDIMSLADTGQDEVLHLWSGLGYYARARNLHKAAKIILRDFDGILPLSVDELVRLPGIGQSTAAAILSLSANQRHAILDGNVKRVLTRYRGITGWPGEKKIEQQLWSLAKELTPADNVASYTQAIMDLGAILCTRSRPRCEDCPVMVDCYASRHAQQSVLPTRRKKNSLPTRETVFAIIENHKGEILLEKRPPVGIWGGLWSFPECPVGENITRWINKQYGSTVSSLTEESTLRHTFSHFHLDIHPVRAKLKNSSFSVKDQEGVFWYKPDSDSRLGMAAPVTRILRTI